MIIIYWIKIDLGPQRAYEASCVVVLNEITWCFINENLTKQRDPYYEIEIAFEKYIQLMWSSLSTTHIKTFLYVHKIRGSGCHCGKRRRLPDCQSNVLYGPERSDDVLQPSVVFPHRCHSVLSVCDRVLPGENVSLVCCRSEHRQLGSPR